MSLHFVLGCKQVLTVIKPALDFPLKDLFNAKPSMSLTKTVRCSQNCRQDREVDGCGQSHIVMQAAASFICSSNSSSRGWFTSTASTCLVPGCPFFFHYNMATNRLKKKKASFQNICLAVKREQRLKYIGTTTHPVIPPRKYCTEPAGQLCPHSPSAQRPISLSQIPVQKLVSHV